MLVEAVYVLIFLGVVTLGTLIYKYLRIPW